MKRFIFALIALGGGLIAPPHASAHAVLTDSFPKPRSVITAFPTRVWLEFDGDLIELPEKTVNVIELRDAKKIIIPITKGYVGGARLTAELPPSKKTGRITITWRIVSEDGHPVTGSIYFTVNPKK